MAPDVENSRVYEFDGFRLDVGKRLLYDPNGKPLPLKAKAFDVLLYFVENRGRVLEKEELLEKIWRGAFIDDNNLTKHISTLRRLMGERPDEHRFIATVAGRGYQFVANVRTDVGSADTLKPTPRNNVLRRLLAIFAIGIATALLLLGFVYKKLPGSGVDNAPKKIAVLPFKPISDSTEDRENANAMTLALISKLERAAGISVYSYSAVRGFTSPDQDPVKAGNELGADMVIEANMQITPDPRVRVSVRFFRTPESKPIWIPDPFDEDYNNILAAQDAMSERIASALRVKLSEYANKRYTDNNEAYVVYSSGRIAVSKLAPPEVKEGIRLLERAIEQDPKFALAYSGIADANMSLVLSGENGPSEFAPRAIAAANKAIAIDPQLAEGYRSRGINAFWFERDWKGADAAFKQALDLDPNSASTRLHYAHFLSNMGRHEQAVEQVEDARKLDSLSAYSFVVQGIVYHHRGNLSEALARFDQAIAKDSQVWLPHMFKAAVLIDLQEYEAALQSAKAASETNTDQTMSIALESFALAKLGRRDEANKLLSYLLTREQQRYVPPYHIAIAYMGLRDHERALEWLDKSRSEGDPKITFLKVDHIWKPLHSNPHFVALLNELNFD